MLPHLRKARRIDPCDLRFLLNGQTVERAYERGTLRTDLSLEETRRRHHVNRYVVGSDEASDFSRLVRPHLPRR